MRRFISLPWKILGVLLFFLVLAASLVAYLWLDKVNQDFNTRQQELRQQDMQMYVTLSQALQSRIEAWFESLVNLQTYYADNLQATAYILESQSEFLQIHWRIEDIWLHDNQNQLLFATNQLMTQKQLLQAEQAKRSQITVSNVQCQPDCLQYISIPLLAHNGEEGVLTVSVSLMDLLAGLSKSTGAKVVVVGSQEPYTNISVQPPVIDSLRAEMVTKLEQVPDNMSFARWQKEGVLVSQQSQQHMLILLPLNQSLYDEQALYLLFAHDLTASHQAYRDYQVQVIVITCAIGCVIAASYFVIVGRLRRRLRALTRHLPLLAHKKYADFRRTQAIEDRWFPDEIEHLQIAASELSRELESLDHQVESNTRELENIAMYDPLTGLPNRNYLVHQLRAQLRAVQRHKAGLCLLFVDFDDFRKVNDGYGHHIGDICLIEASRRLQNTVRQSDTVVRLGSDEFIVLLDNVEHASVGCRVAEKLIASFREPLTVNNERFYLSTSIGMACTQQDIVSADEFIRQADLAMYSAKDAGGNSFAVFDAKMYEQSVRRIEMEKMVRIALQKDQFTFALQPQIDIGSGRLTGFEALVRWTHPEQGPISPNEFIPLLENSDNIIQLGYWGLQKAVDILQELESAGFADLKVAVNLSAAQFLDPKLIPFLTKLFTDRPSYMRLVELELTERTVVSDYQQTLEVMHAIKEMGLTLSIDDFGTGYSALGYLRHIPVDIIKIDREFVFGMVDSQSDRHIVASTISLVRNLGKEVIAEGVETAAALRMLNELECDIAQGYYIARPIPQSELINELKEKVTDGIWNHLDQIVNP